MQKYNENGSLPVTLDVVFAVLFVAAAIFGGWAFHGRQDYKNNVTQKINTAVSAAEKVQATQLNQQFAQESKNPNKTYQGSSTYGSITFAYPKTWSSYIDESNSTEPLNGYFYPDHVPGLNSSTAYALRAELLSTPYSQVVAQFSSPIRQGKVRATAYVPQKMVGKPNLQPGTKLDGVVGHSQAGDQTGSMLIIQVRDKTLEISTESPNFVADFNNSVLANLTFVP